MTINLRPDLEKVVSEAIETGAYQSADEVIERALEMLQSETAWLHDRKHEIASKIERAFEQFERGDFLSAEQSKADLEVRKASWLRN